MECADPSALWIAVAVWLGVRACDCVWPDGIESAARAAPRRLVHTGCTTGAASPGAMDTHTGTLNSGPQILCAYPWTGRRMLVHGQRKRPRCPWHQMLHRPRRIGRAPVYTSVSFRLLLLNAVAGYSPGHGKVVCLADHSNARTKRPRRYRECPGPHRSPQPRCGDRIERSQGPRETDQVPECPCRVA
jgi:hypothetical protein